MIRSPTPSAGHGLRRVFIEGLTQEMLPAFETKIAALREAEQQQARLHGQRDEVRQMLAEMEAAGRQGAKRYQRVKAIEQEVAGLIG